MFSVSGSTLTSVWGPTNYATEHGEATDMQSAESGAALVISGTYPTHHLIRSFI